MTNDERRFWQHRATVLAMQAAPTANLADPTTVVVTDGTPEADASVMRERIQAVAALDAKEG